MLGSVDWARPPLAWALVGDGWWQGEYAIGYAAWHRSSTTRGTFSNMTSEEFANAFEARYDDEPGRRRVRDRHRRRELLLGAAQFAAAVALADAIQTAGTLDTEAVAAELRAQDLTEFYGQLSYDELGQIQEGMKVLQWACGMPTDANVANRGSALRLVYPLRLATGAIRFPTPPWEQRRCGAQKVDELGRECHGRGVCTADGTCKCDSTFGGDTCSENEPAAWQILAVVLAALCFCLILGAFAAAVCMLDCFGQHKALRLLSTGRQLSVPLGAGKTWACFLSHVWATGQDQVAVIKRQLEVLLPSVSVFLDVEDLVEIGELEQYVAQSQLVLIFLTRGFFRSANAMREARATLDAAVPLLVVYEADEKHGGGTLNTLLAECPANLFAPIFGAHAAAANGIGPLPSPLLASSKGGVHVASDKPPRAYQTSTT